MQAHIAEVYQKANVENILTILLEQVAKCREEQTGALQEQLLERAKEVFGKIREDMQKFGEYGVDMEQKAIDK